MAGLWYFNLTSSCRQNFLHCLHQYASSVYVGLCIEIAHRGPMCPPLMFGAKRRCIRLMSLGRTTAPDPRRMERSLVCSLRMRWESDADGILVVCEWQVRVDLYECVGEVQV
jgi:hypothetical protein